MGSPAAVLALAAAVAAVASGGAGCGRAEAPEAPPVPVPPAMPDTNIAARDYVGPAACGECHPDQHARWQASLHAAMNRRAEPDAVICDFATQLPYAGGEARFSREGGAPVMTLARGGRTVRYRVTRTIGVRRLQEYVGIEDGGPGDEVRLPFGFWPARGGWFPQPYFDPWLDEAAADVYAPVREPWAERCPWCHSTYPFELRIARASARPVGHGLEQHFTSAPGGDRLAVERQVTVGISCESCHLGGRAHAAGARITLVPVGASPRPGAPAPAGFARERRDPALVGAVCAQCHSGPSPRFPDGAALRNSSESLDLAAAPCAGVRCTDCHDPHGGPAGAPAELAGALEARAIAACTGCHAGRAGPAHAGPGHAAATCLDCHMPRLVMGVDRHVRSHRISSPTDPAMLGPAPNACNLCHLDRSLGWTLDALARRGVRIDPAAIAGPLDLDTPTGALWLGSPVPGVRLIAASAVARSRLGRAALPALLRGLDDELAYVRAWTLAAVEGVLGRRVPPSAYDPRAGPAERRAQIGRLAGTATGR
jgi:predicted CXXCH cytochrome family protein